jgi:hypothetical protein
MGLEAMNRRAALVLDPIALVIILTGRRDDRRSTSVPVFTWIALALSRSVILSRSAFSLGAVVLLFK